MKNFATSRHGGDQDGIADIEITPRAGHRDTFEALGLLFGVLGVLLGLAITMGATLPIGP